MIFNFNPKLLLHLKSLIRLIKYILSWVNIVGQSIFFNNRVIVFFTSSQADTLWFAYENKTLDHLNEMGQTK